MLNASRDKAPDVIRGFALLGILVVNIQYMALSAEGVTSEWVKGAANGTAAFIVSTLFAGKFYLMFSLMYGYSSSYILKGERSNLKRWIKRCIFLIVLGFLHAIFLWQGDILFWYGVFGLILSLFFFRSDKTLKRWNWGLYLLSNITLLTLSALILITALLGNANETAPEKQPLDIVLRDGSFLDIAKARLDFWTSTSLSAVLLQGGMAFAAFLLGVRLSRRKYFSTSGDPVRRKRLMSLGLGIGLPLEIIAGYIFVANLQSSNGKEVITTVSIVVYFLVAPLLSLLYIQSLLSLIEIKPKFVLWMASAGRMSLTSYISQSVFTSIIFAPWGFGLFQRLQLWQATLLAVLIWLAQTQFARIWLERFNQGPLETFLNKITR